ncbi:MAG: T9SS type A sorting domain-containing protein [Crocinitomicaceae bacterium]|nr:T9SS type A sorting domain-containing protein [Crocinitomicaceae bacterium]
MKKLLLALAIFPALSSHAQNTDTISVMAYNLLNFPQVNSSRIADLKTIVQESLPDILMVCELTSGTGANAILSNALNQNGITYYNKANYVTGPDTQNMLYYNDDKLELLEQNEITTNLRDINEYVLYYESDDIATTSDTTFFYIYVCHLKASQGYESERDAEALAMKNYMATRPNLENVLVGGDFNLYGSSEPAWGTILYGAGVTLVDPIDLPGEWHADWGYQDYHTQSTRTQSFDGGSTGGMDDRFDFIFMSPDLMNWGNQAKMIDGTYWAYGQDGNHYNDELIAPPTNTTLPWTVIQALYDMSDHLPVYAEIEVQRSFNSITDPTNRFTAYYNPNNSSIHFRCEDENLQLGNIVIYDLSGNEVMKFTSLESSSVLDVSWLEKGMYILRESNFGYSMKFVR